MHSHSHKYSDKSSRAAANRFDQQSSGVFTPAQRKFDIAQRQGGLEEEEIAQGKFETVQRQGALEEEEIAQGKFEPVQRQESENRTGMSDNLKFGIESLSGIDMSDVRVHQNSDKPAQLNALAYAQGTDIHVAPGQEQHLAHEAWHVAQQKQGRVQPTTSVNGQNVNDDPALEFEADTMGSKALQAKMANNLSFSQTLQEKKKE